MTDKIIVDNIDVSGCEFYPYVDNDCREYGKCENNPNCYYKQLKRKEAECEIFRKANDEKNKFLQSLGISAGGEFRRIKYYIDKLQDQNKSLQQELRAEKEKVKELEEKLTLAKKDMCQKCDFQKTYFDNTKKLMKEKQKYKQALEEIKEIVTNYCNACKEFECELTNCMYCNYNKILQKCEVLNG